jgi:hypothetical protein
VSQNGLVVGAVNNRGTGDRDDDIIAGYSNGQNPIADATSLVHGEMELPHLVASGSAIDVLNGGTVEGTSFAAPQVAAAAIRMLQANNGLFGNPELSRAILMATADKSIGPPMQTVNARDELAGAGELNADAAAQLADPSNVVAPRFDKPGFAPKEGPGATQGHWVGEICALRIGRWYVESPTAGTLRVAVAFDAVPGPEGCFGSDCGMRPAADVDLSVAKKTTNWWGGGSVSLPSRALLFLPPSTWSNVRTSASFDAAYEYVQVAIAPNTKYRITVGAQTGGCTRIGVAFRTGGN